MDQQPCNKSECPLWIHQGEDFCEQVKRPKKDDPFHYEIIENPPMCAIKLIALKIGGEK